MGLLNVGGVVRALEQKLVAKQPAPSSRDKAQSESDITPPFWAERSPAANARARGGAGRRVPRMTMDPNRAATLKRMQSQMSGRPGPNARKVTSGEVEATRQMVQRGLRRRGIRGDVTVGVNDEGEPYISGPRGRKYPVFPQESA